MTTFFILFVSWVIGQCMCTDLCFKKLLVVSPIIAKAKSMQSALKLPSIWLTWNCLLKADWWALCSSQSILNTHLYIVVSPLFNSWLSSKSLIVQHPLYTQSLAIYMGNALFFILHISYVLTKKKSMCPVWVIKSL